MVGHGALRELLSRDEVTEDSPVGRTRAEAPEVEGLVVASYAGLLSDPTPRNARPLETPGHRPLSSGEDLNVAMLRNLHRKANWLP